MIYVNGERVGPEAVEREKRLMMQYYNKQRPSEALSALVARVDTDARENAVERVLVMQEARRRFPDVPAAAVRKEIAAWRKDLERRGRAVRLSAVQSTAVEERVRDEWRFNALMAEAESTAVVPTGEECLAHYQAHPEAFITEERVRVAHIVRQPAPGQPPAGVIAHLLNVREEVRRGADFAALAAEHSQCADEGGELGWISRGAMVKAFEDVVFALEPGEVSDVFPTEFGYHLALVSARHPAEQQPFEDVRYEIENLLLDERKERARDELIIRLRGVAEIKGIEDIEGPSPA